MTQTMKKNNNRIVALDGLKGIALIIIIAYYFVQHLVPGGFIAVNLLLMIGGFLNFRFFYLAEVKHRKINYKQYYLTKIGRFFFPMLFMMIIAVSLILFLASTRFVNLRSMGISSLFFVNNYYQIINQQSYFNQTIIQSIFSHLWFVALYVQLVLVTPIINHLVFRWNKSTTIATNMLIVISLVSMIMMTYLHFNGADTTRIYFDILPRISSYTLGGALAFMLPATLSSKEYPKKIRWILNGVGMGSVLLAVVMISFMYGNRPFAFRYGLSIFNILAMTIVFIAMCSGTFLQRFFSLKPFVYLGRRTFSYYLWFYPTIMILPAILKPISRNYYVYLAVGVILIVLLSEMTFYLIETKRINLPFGQDFNISKSKYRLNYLRQHPGKLVKVKTISVIYLIFFIIGIVGMLIAPQTGSGVIKQLADTMNQNKEIVKMTTDPTSKRNIVINNNEGLSAEVNLYVNAMEITFIGDSYFLSSAHRILDVFPKAIIDADEGRNLYSSVNTIQVLKQNDLLAPMVVTMLGDNTSFTKGQLTDYIEEIGEERIIYFVLLGTNRAWSDQVNERLNEAAKQYGNVRLIDWASSANTHPEWLLNDIYPNDEGAMELAKLLANELYRLR